MNEQPQQQTDELLTKKTMLALYSVVIKILDNPEVPDTLKQEITDLLELSPDQIHAEIRDLYFKDGIREAIKLAEGKVEQAQLYEADCVEATLLSFIEALKMGYLKLELKVKT